MPGDSHPEHSVSTKCGVHTLLGDSHPEQGVATKCGVHTLLGDSHPEQGVPTEPARGDIHPAVPATMELPKLVYKMHIKIAQFGPTFALATL